MKLSIVTASHRKLVAKIKSTAVIVKALRLNIMLHIHTQRYAYVCVLFDEYNTGGGGVTSDIQAKAGRDRRKLSLSVLPLRVTFSSVSVVISLPTKYGLPSTSPLLPPLMATTQLKQTAGRIGNWQLRFIVCIVESQSLSKVSLTTDRNYTTVYSMYYECEHWRSQ